jgi:hypothetical protein
MTEKKEFEIRAGKGSAFLNSYRTEDWQAKWSGKYRHIDGKLYKFFVDPKIDSKGVERVEFSCGKEIAEEPKKEATQGGNGDVVKDLGF